MQNVSTNNLAFGDSNAPGSNAQQNVAPTYVNSASDWHLGTTDTAALAKGADLSADANFPFSTDIDGETRSAPWDIGADKWPGTPLSLDMKDDVARTYTKVI